MKTFKVKNYKGNLLESTKKFQELHKNMRIVEAFEDAGILNIMAEPNTSDPALPPPSDLPADTVAAQQEPVEPVDAIMSFGCKVLTFGVEAHFWHLNCLSNSQHLALKELYEACDDVGDRLLESRIGSTGKPVSMVVAEFGSDDLNRDADAYVFGKLEFSETSISEIIALRNEAESLIGQGGAGVDNILGEFCETCDSITYKLKRLL